MRQHAGEQQDHEGEPPPGGPRAARAPARDEDPTEKQDEGDVYADRGTADPADVDRPTHGALLMQSSRSYDQPMTFARRPKRSGLRCVEGGANRFGEALRAIRLAQQRHALLRGALVLDEPLRIARREQRL